MINLFPSIEQTQRRELAALLQMGQKTAYGASFGMSPEWSYETFRAKIPKADFGDLSRFIELMKAGRADQLWPGVVSDFAVSSGTTGNGKHIPVPEERIASDRRFLRHLSFRMLLQHKSLRPLLGKHISIPGYLEERAVADHTTSYGEITGILARHIPGWLTRQQLLTPQELTNCAFPEKMKRLIERAPSQDVRVISAMPGWTLHLFREIMRGTGSDTIRGVWPNLQVIVAGGCKLSSYRSSLNELIGDETVDYIETYAASEGYFAYSLPGNAEGMQLMIDNGIFYEWQPLDQPEESPVPTWQLESGRRYEMVVSCNSGLWRYPIGDAIRCLSTHPLRIAVDGRVNAMLDEYGEAVYEYELRDALRSALPNHRELPLFCVTSKKAEKESVPRHHWFIADAEGGDLEELAKAIDDYLSAHNRHYQIRRSTEILGKPALCRMEKNDLERGLLGMTKRASQAKLPVILDLERAADFLAKTEPK